MKRQDGQSMTEYLVVLGVTGALITTMVVNGDMDRLLDAMHNNYQGYSSAMSDVQDYGEVAVTPIQEVEPGDGMDDDDASGGDDIPETPEPSSLGKVNQIYDSFGNPLGTVVGDKIYDASGNLIGEYLFDAVTGKQTAKIGDTEYDGVSVISTVVDQFGDELFVKALVLNGNLVGFGYFTAGVYYDALSGNEIKGLASGMQAEDTREVKIRDSQGKELVYGVEYNGYAYSLAKVQAPNQSYLTKVEPDGELVEVFVSETDTVAAWSGYSTCIVRSYDWVHGELKGYAGVSPFVFDKIEDDGNGNDVPTSNAALVSGPKNNSGYLADTGSSGCQARWAVVEGSDDWQVVGPLRP